MASRFFEIFRRVKDFFSQSETQEQQPPQPPQPPQEPQPRPPQEPQPRPPQPPQPQEPQPRPPQPPQQPPQQQQREERLREQLTLQMLQQQQKQQQLRERQQQLSEPKKSEEAHEELQKLKAVLLQRQQQQLEQQRQLLRDQKQRIEEKRQQLKQQEQEQPKLQKQKPQFRVSFNEVHMGPAKPAAQAKLEVKEPIKEEPIKEEPIEIKDNVFNPYVFNPVLNFFSSIFSPKADLEPTTKVENLEKKPTEQQPVETSKDKKPEVQQKTERMTAAEIREDLVSQGFVPMNEPTTKKKPTTPPLNNPLPCNEVKSTKPRSSGTRGVDTQSQSRSTKGGGRRIDDKPGQRHPKIRNEIPEIRDDNEIPTQRPYPYPREKPVIPTGVYIQERLDRARELAGLAFEGIRNQTAYSQKLPSEQTVNVPLTKQFEKMKERLGNLKASEVVEGAREKLRGARENGRLAALRIGAVTEEIEERMGRDNKYQQELDRNEINKKTRMDKLGNTSHLNHANQQPRKQTQTDEAVQKLYTEATKGCKKHEKQQPQKHSSRHPPVTNGKPMGLNTPGEYELHQEAKKPSRKNLLPSTNPTAYYTHAQYAEYQKKVSKPRNLPPSTEGR